MDEMKKKQAKIETMETYNKAAYEYAEKFNKLERVADIQEVFEMWHKENNRVNPKVLEIGCGNGRDASVILRHTNDYIGVDISSEFIKLAKASLPKSNFIEADIETYIFPHNMDIVFAFASLLHVDKKSFKNILEKIHENLNNNGIVRISLKHADKYQEILKEDKFGKRIFYYYSENDIIVISTGYEIKKSMITNLLGQNWLEIILQKI